MPVAGVAERVQPGGIKDASIAADYVNSLAGHYQPEVTRPWSHVAEGVRKQVQTAIDARGEFRTAGDLAAFVCRQLPAQIARRGRRRERQLTPVAGHIAD